jgi:hypothetical protein
MKQRHTRTLHVVAMALLLAGAASAERAPSTPEERAKAVQLAKELEAEPLGAGADEKRRWLLQWWDRIPDISVNVSLVLGTFPEGDHPYWDKLLFQLVFSGGAFMIEHPEQAKDEVAVQTAALEGALKVYRVLDAATPGHRIPYLDEMTVKQRDGTLRSHVAGIVKDGAPKK